jgi:hypothetical protein
VRFDLTRGTLTASTGTNFLRVLLPAESRLKLVYARNTTTGWLLTQLALAHMSEGNVDAATIGLAWESQDGPRTGVKWSGDVRIGEDFRSVLATFFDCIAGDLLTLNVGVEQQ